MKQLLKVNTRKLSLQAAETPSRVNQITLADTQLLTPLTVHCFTILVRFVDLLFRDEFDEEHLEQQMNHKPR